ncbi:HAD family hydrolase [Glycomyces sp. NPDC046736]|uniref:HAD family hydrolase n=1 Tax=Glycomyces sp. NPDC046736 TaxID=3155615 RepID=UPI0033FD1DA0
MRPPKVIAADLDGTLLGPGQALTDRTRAALDAARAVGIAVVAATARPPRVFTEWPDLAARLDAAICANGALVYDPGSRVVLGARALTAETAAVTAKTLRAALPEARFAVETGSALHAEPGYAKIDSVGDYRIFHESFEVVLEAADPIVKLLAHVPGATPDAVLAAGRTVDLPGVSVSHSGGAGLLEVSAAGVDKATALAAWCAERGVGAAEVVAFGDAPNDVPMLAWAGRSFAVANAHPEAAAAASDSCASNADDGVAEAIEALLR